MGEKIDFYLTDLENDKGASDASIAELQKSIDSTLPDDYIQLVKQFDGGEGEVGENSWLCLFPIESVVETNKAYFLLMEQIPDYFLFGKDAADTGYAFHKLKHTFVSFGLMSDFETDFIEHCGNSIIEFIEYLYNESSVHSSRAKYLWKPTSGLR